MHVGRAGEEDRRAGRGRVLRLANVLAPLGRRVSTAFVS